jgi:hypothetical protein
VLQKISIYGYLNRIQSSRRLEMETQRNIEMMWLTRRLILDFKTIAIVRARRCPNCATAWVALSRPSASLAPERRTGRPLKSLRSDNATGLPRSGTPPLSGVAGDDRECNCLLIVFPGAHIQRLSSGGTAVDISLPGRLPTRRERPLHRSANRPSRPLPVAQAETMRQFKIAKTGHLPPTSAVRDYAADLGCFLHVVEET